MGIRLRIRIYGRKLEKKLREMEKRGMLVFLEYSWNEADEYASAEAVTIQFLFIDGFCCWRNGWYFHHGKYAWVKPGTVQSSLNAFSKSTRVQIAIFIFISSSSCSEKFLLLDIQQLKRSTVRWTERLETGFCDRRLHQETSVGLCPNYFILNCFVSARCLAALLVFVLVILPRPLSQIWNAYQFALY